MFLMKVRFSKEVTFVLNLTDTLEERCLDILRRVESLFVVKLINTSEQELFNIQSRATFSDAFKENQDKKK